jgi:galactoside O-acetyltransferase
MTRRVSLAGNYYAAEDLRAAGFRAVGSDVLIHERTNIFGAEHIAIGDHVRIDQFVNIVATSPIDIGSYVHIAAFSHISVSCGLTIGAFSAFGAGSKVFTSSSDFDGEFLPLPLESIPVEYRKDVVRGPVLFAGHNIVGTNALVLPGVTFAEGAAVGAMSVVSSDLEQWSFYLGSPARKVRERSKHIVAIAKRLESGT